MSPELRINGKLIADLPDETGYYRTPVGEIYINVENICGHKETDEIELRGEIIKGKTGRATDNGIRTIQLSEKGVGSQQLSKTEILTVTLKNRLIWRTHKVGTLWWSNEGSCFTAPKRPEWEIHEMICHPRWRRNCKK